jgi:glucose 1-dehydrogenase
MMKAVGVFPGRREVRLIDHHEPRISAPEQVKLRMIEVGVCGTDRDICAFHYGTAPPGCDHFILGHESLAEVVEVGTAVSRVKAGDLVVAAVRRPCPHASCAACRSGRPDFCSTGDYREHGIKDMHGFLTEFVVEEEPYLHVVPPDLRDVAILVEPLTIAEKALIQARAIRERLPWRQHPLRAVVLGAGPVGLLGAMALVQSGYHTFVWSREPASSPRAAIASAIGAHYMPPGDAEPIDLVYEATGASQFAFDALTVLGANGIFVLTGVPRGDQVELDTGNLLTNLVLKNQVVVGTVNAGSDAFRAAIRDLTAFTRRWPAAVRALLTGRYPLEAFADLIFGDVEGIKNVIQIGA